MARRRSYKKYGRVFTTRKGRRGRYIYNKAGRRIGFKPVAKFVGRNAKKGVARYIQYRTYRSLRNRF